MEFTNNPRPNQVPPRPDPSPNTTFPGGFTPPPVPERKSKRKKVMVIILVLVLLLGAAAGAWFYTQRDKTPEVVQTPNTPAPPVKQELRPSSVLYAVGDSIKSPISFRLNPLDSDKYTISHTLSKNDHISQYDIHENKVGVAVEPGDGSKTATTVLYSEDAGKTFKSIFTGAKSDDETGLGSQITSLKFSDDGSKIVMGHLPTEGPNTVTELDPATGTTKDLFAAKERGVFIEAYNTTRQEVFYYAGCYNCDGGRFDKLFKRDLKAEKDTIAYQDTARIGVRRILNHDSTKLLLVKGSEGEGLGAGPPYDIVEVDLQTKKTTNVLSNYKPTADDPKVGYLDGTNTIYYTKGKDVYQYKDGAATQLFKGTQELVAVHFVDEDTLVATFGPFDKSTVSNVDLKTKKATRLFSGDEYTAVIGVTWQ